MEGTRLWIQCGGARGRGPIFEGGSCCAHPCPGVGRPPPVSILSELIVSPQSVPSPAGVSSEERWGLGSGLWVPQQVEAPFLPVPSVSHHLACRACLLLPPPPRQRPWVHIPTPGAAWNHAVRAPPNRHPSRSSGPHGGPACPLLCHWVRPCGASPPGAPQSVQSSTSSCGRADGPRT